MFQSASTSRNCTTSIEQHWQSKIFGAPCKRLSPIYPRAAKHAAQHRNASPQSVLAAGIDTPLPGAIKRNRSVDACLQLRPQYCASRLRRGAAHRMPDRAVPSPQLEAINPPTLLEVPKSSLLQQQQHDRLWRQADHIPVLKRGQRHCLGVVGSLGGL